MKLRIENEDAGSSTFSKPYKVPEIRGNEILLTIELEDQLYSRWCWAAIGSTMAQYYESASLKGQEAIASVVLNQDVPSLKASKKFDNEEEWNCNTQLDKVLDLLNCFGHWSLGKPSFERIQYEINNGHPVCLRVEWYKGGAHYVILKGYHSDQKEVIVADPLNGVKRIAYDDFPKNYETGGIWTETFWTEKK